jgi:hypothetical protein
LRKELTIQPVCEPNFWQTIGSIQNIVAALIAALTAIIYNLNAHRHDVNVFKSDLFFKLNARYEVLRDQLERLSEWETEVSLNHAMNPTTHEPLNALVDAGLSDPFSRSWSKFKPIFDYVALCSEQYYLFSKNQVDPDVWQSWKEGMLNWHQVSLSLRNVIELEKDRGFSYYKADFLELFKEP